MVAINKRLIRDELRLADLRAQEEEIAARPVRGVSAFSGLRTTPWRHQREAVAFVRGLYRRGKRGAMIAAVLGTGKSAMTVYLCV
ncbi:MAG TPA: hypothetical protein PKW45_11755, partial [Bryobacteraceae bacterium]|nr:hypothetical protein [Bryobacteraceae bacterium]